ncbi:hypothetical protein K449DRAFT_84190 [Hypoxylon sp. EC38]|nr:hypothetical protein K449DRAFT_84190 [Hypoxylon sp. EC38]
MYLCTLDRKWPFLRRIQLCLQYIVVTAIKLTCPPIRIDPLKHVLKHGLKICILLRIVPLGRQRRVRQLKRLLFHEGCLYN